MGYTLEFWSLPLAEVPGGDILQVAERVRAAGNLVGSIDHSSAGGDWFRTVFLGRLAAGVIGAQTMQHLLDRPIKGVTTTTSAYPALGWLSHEEITEALAHATDPATAGADSEDTDLLDTVLTALHNCPTDLVTIYG